MGKQIMLVDPQIENEPLYVDFYDKYYAPVINDQYICDLTPKQVCTTMNRFTRIIPFEVYFATQKDCVNAIDTIGEENLKKYYFDIKEEK